MKKQHQIELIRRLVGESEHSSNNNSSASTEITPGFTQISTDRYTDKNQLNLEQAALFHQLPIIVAHSSEIADAGSYVTEEIDSVPLIILRDHDNNIRVFVNACRHRGAKLLQGDKGKCRRLMVCPYHAWSYKLNGDLAAVPERESFGDANFAALDLVPVQFSEYLGYIWAVLDGDAQQPLDVAAMLGDTLSQDFEHFNFDQQLMYTKVKRMNECNWKLVMDAFAEGYHLRSLHKDSLSRFFMHSSIHDDCYPHVRQMGGRKTLIKEIEKKPEDWNFRLNTTLFYNVFPNTILVFHPHWISQMSLFPDGPNKVRIVHRMIVEKLPENDEIKAKLEASFDHIQGQVFEKEDLAISADIQTTLASGVNTHFTVGGMEAGVKIFHAARDNFIAAYKKQRNELG